MEKKEISILKSGIEVPPVVQKKADAAFAAIQKERTEAMENKEREQRTKKERGKIRRLVKPLIAVAACAALIAGAGSGLESVLEHTPFSGNFSAGLFADRTAEQNGGSMNENGGIAGVSDENEVLSETQNGEAVRSGESGQNGESTADDGTGKTEETQERRTSRNWFTLTACAKELEPGKPVPLTDMGNSGRSWVLGGSGDEGRASYCIATDFLCQGENIEQVSYSISRGAFQIVQPIDPAGQIVVEGQLFDGSLNVGQIGSAWDEETGLEIIPSKTALYQSFTLDYDRQSSDAVWINICNELWNSEEIVALIWGDGGEATPLEKKSEGINRMLDSVVITCTAHYADGTSQSVEIEVSSSVMTYGEAGADGNGEIPADTEGVFITFEVK